MTRQKSYGSQKRCLCVGNIHRQLYLNACWEIKIAAASDNFDGLAHTRSWRTGGYTDKQQKQHAGGARRFTTLTTGARRKTTPSSLFFPSLPSHFIFYFPPSSSLFSRLSLFIIRPCFPATHTGILFVFQLHQSVGVPVTLSLRNIYFCFLFEDCFSLSIRLLVAAAAAAVCGPPTWPT